MKFYLAEGNVGKGTTREQVDNVIKLLKSRGWDVEYGVERNKAENVSEFGREEEIQDEFSKDFMKCVEVLGL
jgi:hypothetical protein